MLPHDPQSFLGIAIGDNAQWLSLQNPKDGWIKSTPEGYFLYAGYFLMDANQFITSRFPGPFPTREDAEAWLAWALVQLN